MSGDIGFAAGLRARSARIAAANSPAVAARIEGRPLERWIPAPAIVSTPKPACDAPACAAERRAMEAEILVLRVENETLRKRLLGPAAPCAPKAIIQIVATLAGVTAEEILGQQREWRLTVPRHIAMLLVSEHCPMSYPRLAHQFNRCDHTTAMHGVKAARIKIQTLAPARALYDAAKAEITKVRAHEAAQ